MKRKLLKLLQMKSSVNQGNFNLDKRLSVINVQMKTFFILLIVNLFSFAASAQNTELDRAVPTSNEAAIYSNFNLAPGMIFNPKKIDLVDYSFMLEHIPAAEPENFKNDDFLKVIPQEKLDYWKASEPQVYQYYATAKSFYDNLPNRVKAVFSVEVLWHIYYYDQKLKNKLQSIK